MGLFSSSSRSSTNYNQTTNNTSVTQALNNSGGGVAVWGEGNTVYQTTTDAGAMQAANDMLMNTTGMVSDLARTFTGFGDSALQVAANSNDRMAGLAERVVGASENMAFGAFDLSDRTTQRGLEAAENLAFGAFDLSDRTTSKMGELSMFSINAQNDLARDGMALSRDAMHYNSNLAADSIAAQNALARESMLYGGELARDFMAGSQDAQKQAQQTVLDTTRYALQFADNQTRSDGQQYAVEASKNNMYTMIAVAGVVALVVFMGRK